MKQLTIKDLYERTLKAIEKCHGDAPVYFDTEAVCFDVHLVAVSSASFDDSEYMMDLMGIPAVMTMHWDMPSEPHHWNKDYQ